MSFFLDALRKVGLVSTRAVPTATTDPATLEVVTTRSVTLDELLSESAAPLPTGTADLGATPEAVFAAAGLEAPEHGWTVERVLEFVTRPTYAEMSHDLRQRAILVVLARDNVSAEDVLKEVVRRDQALDRYEEILAAKVAGERRRLEMQREQWEAEVRELQKKIAQQGEVAASLDKRLDDWRRRKVEMETGWALGASYLTAEPTVTVSKAP